MINSKMWLKINPPSLFTINIDTQSLNTYSAIIQLPKNEEVVLIGLIEACDHAVLCERVSFTLSRQ